MARGIRRADGRALRSACLRCRISPCTPRALTRRSTGPLSARLLRRRAWRPVTSLVRPYGTVGDAYQTGPEDCRYSTSGRPVIASSRPRHIPRARACFRLRGRAVHRIRCDRNIWDTNRKMATRIKDRHLWANRPHIRSRKSNHLRIGVQTRRNLCRLHWRLAKAFRTRCIALRANILRSDRFLAS